MKNYSEIEDIVSEVVNNKEKIFNLILNYERESIDPEDMEELKDEIKGLKETMKELVKNIEEYVEKVKAVPDTESLTENVRYAKYLYEE